MPKYKLNNGEVVDTSNFSEEEENDWLFDNSDNIDLDYDFQNGAVETDASATPVNNPASNGDSISEDGLSDGVDPYSKFNVTAEDLVDKSEEDLLPFLNERLSRLGISANRTNTFGSFDAIDLNNSVDPEMIGTSVGGDVIPDLLKGFGLDFSFNGIAVGKNKTKEELQEAALRINEYIKSKGDLSYLEKAKERSYEEYEAMEEAVTPPEMNSEEVLLDMKENKAAEFEKIQSGGEMVDEGGGLYTKRKGEATIKDFQSEQEFLDYKDWEKTGVIRDFSQKEMDLYDRARKEKYMQKESLTYANNLEGLFSTAKKMDVLALASEDKEKLTNFEKYATDYIDLRSNLDEVVANYKKNPTKDNYFNALELQNEAISRQGKIQQMQNRLKSSGIADRSMTIPLALQDFNKDYNRVKQLGGRFKTTALDLVFPIAQLSLMVPTEGQNIYNDYSGSEDSSSVIMNKMLEERYGLITLGDELRKEGASYQRTIEVDEIRSLDDASMWAASSVVNLIPSLAMAATGPFAMPLFFLSGSGSKGFDVALSQKNAAVRMKQNLDAKSQLGDDDQLELARIDAEIKEDARVLNLSAVETISAQALYGAAEVVLERFGTMALWKNLSKGVTQLAPIGIKQQAKFIGKTLGKGIFTEGGTEFATSVVQNLVDIGILGEDKNIFEGALESFAQGALMGGGMSSINTYRGIRQGMVSVLQSKEESEQLNNYLNSLREITGIPAQGWGDIAPQLDSMPKEVREVAERLIKKMQTLEQGIVTKIGTELTPEQAYEVEEVNRKMRLANKRLVIAAQNPNISKKQLKAIKAQLDSELAELVVQREKLLTNQDSISDVKKQKIINDFKKQATSGFQFYTQRMLFESRSAVSAAYDGLSSSEKQKGLEKAKADLIKKGIKNPSKSEIAKEAKKSYINKSFKDGILKSIENVKAFAEAEGVDVNVKTFEGPDADSQILQLAKEGGATAAQLKELSEALENGEFNGATDAYFGNNLVVHLDAASNNGKIGVATHEMLHQYIKQKYGEGAKAEAAIEAAGKDLLSYLEKNNPELYDIIKATVDRNYTGIDSSGKIVEDANYYEEVLTAMSDVFAEGYKVNKPLMKKITSFVNSFLAKIGKDPFFKEDETQNKEVYLFVVNYNQTAHFGKGTNKKAPKKKTKNVNRKRVFKSRSKKLTEAEENRMEAIDQEIDEISNELMQGFIDQDGHDRKIAKLEEEYENIENPPKVEAKPKPKAERKAKSPNTKEKDLKKEKVLIGDAINKMIPEGMTLAEWPSVAGKIVEAFQKGMLLPLFKKQIARMGIVADNIYGNTVQEFYDATIGVQFIKNILNFKPKTKDNPQGNNDFAGYIIGSSFGLNNRIKEALAALKKGKELNEASDVSTTKGIIAEESSNEVKEKPKYRKLTEAGVVASEVIDAIRAKLKSTLRTLKTRMDAAISNNRTVTPLMAEIQFEMGKQADIDLKKAMGGKKDGKLRKFLLKTKKAVLQNMTTTWLMGKDGQGGIPQAIQKKVDGKWLSYPAWVGKEIDREKTSTDNAGRTSGALLVRRHPNIVNYKNVDEIIDNDTYLAQFLDETGNPIRGRKEALAKAMAEEISFEIFTSEIVNPASEISGAFEANQERQGVVLADNFVQQLESDVDRGNIKFSITKARQKELNKLWAKTWRTTSESKRLEAVEDLKKRLKVKEERDYIETVDNMLTAEINEILELNWQEKEQRLIDFTNKFQDIVPGLTIKQKTTQKNPNKADLVFSLYGQEYAWEAKGSRNAILATFYMGAWWEGGFKIKRKNVSKATKDLIEEADQGNDQMQEVVDLLEDMYKTKEYVNMDPNSEFFGQRRKLEPKDRITKLKNGNYKMPRWFYKNYINGFYSMGKINGGAVRKFKIKGGLAAVVKVYNGKSPLPVRYITLADIGDLSMGSLDPLNLKLPKLKGDVDVTVRFQPNFSETTEQGYVTLSRVASLKMTAETANTLSKKAKTNLFREDSAKETFIKASNPSLSITKQAAINNAASIKYSQTPKGISVFDFDDTLARTKSNVLYVTADGKKGKLNAAQFAARSETMLAQGVEFDFSEFSKVMKGELGPLFSEAQKKEGKYTNKDIFVLTARPANSAKAIHEFLKSEGLNIPLNNITGLGNGSPKAKADWMVSKIAEGYNDFYFADDHMGNVKAVGKALKSEGVTGQTELSIVDFKNQPKAVRDILNTFDVKGPTQRSRVKFSRTANKTINDMLERASGIPSRKRLTRIEGAELGKKKGRFKIWMPSSLEDFRGLTEYTFAGKGRQGDIDQKFIRDALVTPYWRGINEMDQVKQSLKNGFAALNKQFKPVLKKLGKKMPGMEYTHDQAIRVYLWNKAGYEIPGLTKKLERTLVAAVQADADLLAYANGALRLSQRKQWSKPSDYWNVQTILSDINNFTEKAGRKEYLKEFIDNADLIFSEKNLNKIEAIYGKAHREAIEDILYRMKNGTNRAAGMKKNEQTWNNWLNNSIGAIMFFNRRSALLQLLSTVNFVNWSDNNPMKAAAAFANQKQYWADFAMIFNSASLKQRRSGLKTDVNAAELASAVTGATDKASAALNYLLKIGFTPTQIVDSFAISAGGATLYRNRLNTYLKEKDAKGNPKYTQKEAEKQAFYDFSVISRETQQSGDPALISSDQSSSLGRVVLNFMNTPIQLNRSIKKSAQNIYYRRREPGMTQMQSDFSNFSKIIYYGTIQNAIFSTLQAAMFALIPGFNDDDDELDDLTKQEKIDKKTFAVINSMIDTTLKGGFGLPGAVVSILKNAIIEYKKQEDRGFLADDSKTLIALLNISPAVGSKGRKIVNFIKTERFDKEVINERGWDVTIDGKFNLSPRWSSAGNLVEGTLNIPVARVVDELNSITEALDSRNTAYQRIALALGWKTWNVGAKNEENDLIEVVAKYRNKLKKKAETKAKKAAEKLKERRANIQY